MTFERFSQLWDETIKNNPRTEDDLEETEMAPRTREALIAYGKGDKSLMENLKKEWYERNVRTVRTI